MKRHGFTLLEILLVIGLIVILAAMAIGGMSYASGKADEAATLATMKELEMALEKYKTAKGHYPLFTTAVDTNFKDSANKDKWKSFKNGGYLSGDYGDEVKDAYGNFFRYKCPGTYNKEGYDLWSQGEDTSNLEDDLCNWK